MPVRIAIYCERGGKKDLWFSLENELAQVQPGLWLPVKSVRRGYSVDRKSAHYGKEVGTELIELDLKRSRFNVHLDDSVFAMDFPVGTKVQDYQRDATYRVGTGNRESYLHGLAVAGRLGLEELKNRQPWYQTEAVPTIPLWRKVLLGALLATVGCVCLLLVERLRSQRRLLS
jgi:hypothetical protein